MNMLELEKLTLVIWIFRYLESENADGFFIFNICGIFYHIGDLLLRSAKENALGNTSDCQHDLLCLVSTQISGVFVI